MTERILETQADLDLWIAFLRGRPLPQTVTTIDGRDRSGQQNAIQWLWATEAARQLGDRTPAEIRNEWKLRIGVPILREDSDDFRKLYDEAIKPLPYELKVKSMEFIPVTSKFKVSQMVRYLDTVQRECLQQGMQLTDPDPALASYQKRYRENPILTKGAWVA